MARFGALPPEAAVSGAGARGDAAVLSLDARRLILPAFGAYTGGLHADSPALARLLAPDARAVVTGEPCVTVPLAALA